MENDIEMGCTGETNWVQSAGSLDQTLIFYRHIPPEEPPRIESRPLVLTAPQGSGSCEITLKFEGKLCDVHSVYIRSTSRVFEFYNKPELSVDNEYLSTARGELTMQNDDADPVRGSISKDDSSSFSRDDSIHKSLESELSLPIENATQQFLKVEKYDIESTDDLNSSDILDGGKGQTLQSLLQEDSIKASEESTKAESHYSDEDSWIEVKLSGSFEMNSLGEPGGIAQLQSFCNKTIQESEESIKNEATKISNQDSLDPEKHKHLTTEDAHFDQNVTKEKLVSLGVSNKHLVETNVDTKVRTDKSLVTLSRSNFVQKKFYEATVKLVDAQPCVSLTIRLLSLQDKSSVEIDQICVYGLPASAITAGTESINFSSSNLQGSSFGGSLLAMLIPGMIQMSRGGLSQRQHGLSFNSHNFERDMSRPKLESSNPASSVSSYPPSMADMATSMGENLSAGMLPGKNVSPEPLMHQERLPHSGSSPHSHLDEVGKNIETEKNNFKTTMQSTPPSRETTNNIFGRKNRKNESGSETSYTAKMTEIAEKLPDRMGGLYMEESDEQCRPEELQNNQVDEGMREKPSEEKMFEYVCKRMDRLEALCMRIEEYMHRSMSNMERRIKLVESYQMLPNQSMMTKMEGVTVQSGSCLSSNSFLNSPVSCPETLSDNDLKHTVSVNTPSPLCAEVLSSISMPRASPMSFTESSLVGDASSPSVILPSDASCMGTSVNLESENMHSLPCHEDPSKAGFHISPDTVLNQSVSSSLDQHGYPKEEHFIDKDFQSVQCSIEGVLSGSEVSSKFYHEDSTPQNPGLSLEEALASALSAFSASVAPVQVETMDTFTEAPPVSLQRENTDDKEVCYHDSLSHLEKTGMNTATHFGSLEVDNTDHEGFCYHDAAVFNAFEGVRYKSQENMGSVAYTSSQGSQDSKPIVYKGGNITDPQDGVVITTEQSHKPGAVLAMNHDSEVMSLEKKTECELQKIEKMPGINVSHTVNVIPNMSRLEQETNILLDFQEQLRPLEGSEELVSSKMCSKRTKLIIDKEQDLVADKSSSFSPFSGKCESELSGLEDMLNGAKMERQGDIAIGSNNFTEDQDKHAPIKFQMDPSSLLDVSFTSSDTVPMNMSLESLLCSHTPDQSRETLCFQKNSETETYEHFIEPKRLHGLFFVEDEDIGDFITSSSPKPLCSITTGSTSDQGLIHGVSLGFESLL